MLDKIKRTKKANNDPEGSIIRTLTKIEEKSALSVKIIIIDEQ